MIKYSKTSKGDILKIVGAGAPGLTELGDLVRVTKVESEGCTVETKTGSTIEFVFNCGAARLEPTEWKDDFPQETGEQTPEQTPPMYGCKKIVHAHKISSILFHPEGNATIVPLEEGYSEFDVSKEYTEKHDPKAGGYWVKYEDGYQSFSPADAFEKGYDRI